MTTNIINNIDTTDPFKDSYFQNALTVENNVATIIVPVVSSEELYFRRRLKELDT